MTSSQSLVFKAAGTANGLKKVKKLLTLQNLLARDEMGETTFHEAARSGGIQHIPKTFLTTENLTIRSSMFDDMPLHLAAHYGSLKFLSQTVPKVLTEENLSLSTRLRGTVFHAAAQGKALAYIPCEFLTEKHLSVLDEWGNTVLHQIALAADFKRLPVDMLTPRYFLKTNNLKMTVFHSAASKGSFSGIPEHLLTWEVLASEDDNCGSVINYFIDSQTLPRLPIAPMVGHLKEVKSFVKAYYEYQHEPNPLLTDKNLMTWFASLAQAELQQTAIQRANQAKRNP